MLEQAEIIQDTRDTFVALANEPCSDECCECNFFLASFPQGRRVRLFGLLSTT